MEETKQPKGWNCGRGRGRGVEAAMGVAPGGSTDLSAARTGAMRKEQQVPSSERGVGLRRSSHNAGGLDTGQAPEEAG